MQIQSPDIVRSGRGNPFFARTIALNQTQVTVPGLGFQFVRDPDSNLLGAHPYNFARLVIAFRTNPVDGGLGTDTHTFMLDETMGVEDGGDSGWCPPFELKHVQCVQEFDDAGNDTNSLVAKYYEWRGGSQYFNLIQGAAAMSLFFWTGWNYSTTNSTSIRASLMLRSDNRRNRNGFS
jgi:hypothetical protein